MAGRNYTADDYGSCRYVLENRVNMRATVADLGPLTPARAQRLILHIQHWLATLPARGGPPAADVGRNALKTNVRRLRRLGRLTVHKPIAEIHAIRIKSKKTARRSNRLRLCRKNWET